MAEWLTELSLTSLTQCSLFAVLTQFGDDRTSPKDEDKLT